MSIRMAFLLLLLGTAACAPAATISTPARSGPPPITEARAVVAAMHTRYVGKFFTTLRFKQHTVTTTSTGRETKGIWNEYIVLPGKLRIDYQPLSSHSGVLY